jgi:hypothetical protein
MLSEMVLPISKAKQKNRWGKKVERSKLAHAKKRRADGGLTAHFNIA